MATTTDGTYFVGRNELLSWINSTLSLGLTKIEQVRRGGEREEKKEEETDAFFSLSSLSIRASSFFWPLLLITPRPSASFLAASTRAL